MRGRLDTSPSYPARVDDRTAAADSRTASFLVLHGWQNRRPAGHWQRWLTDELRARGHRVAYPQLPDPDEPDLTTWLDVLDRELDALEGDERVVVCHSLACALWLHGVARGLAGPPVDRLLLVAPAAPAFLAGQPAVAAFVPPAVDVADVARTSRSTRLVAADDDVYCEGGAAREYSWLGVPTDVLPGAGHLDLDAGYGPWPNVLEWCLDGEVRLRAR